MSDRYATDTETRPAPNPHDTALVVFRPEIYGEAAAWLEQTRPRAAAGECPPRGYDVATQRLRERQTEAAAAPGASQLDHVSAAYYRQAADSLDNAGHHASATLLRHVADDFDAAGRE
jgi:hypothetical protein